jgi:7,8-dihydropterin-6-yl-methyl-4-(beta-D-ribofuranosyl)aminobenzene 5'-phosphate synthase
LIETDGVRILFDTAQRTLIPNAEHLGISLSDIDYLILSHGHYDHTGGLRGIFDENPSLKIIAHRKIFAPHYSVKNGIVRDISIPESAKAVIERSDPERVLFIDRTTELFPSVYLFACVPKKYPVETIDAHLFADSSLMTPDPVEEEIHLGLVTRKGLVIVTGCCHAGIMNTCDHIMRETGATRIHAIIGGLHLKEADESRITKTAEYLRRHAERVFPFHCTGDAAASVFLSPGNTGPVKSDAGMKIII